MSYQIGTIFHGTSRTIGNLWIVTHDNSRNIALLWDGKHRSICPDFRLTRHDIIRPGVTLTEATIDQVRATIGGIQNLPLWAEQLIQARSNVGLGTLPKPSAQLTPAVLAKVHQTLGLTPEVESARVKIEAAHSNCLHEFKLYVGLFSVFYYCVHCDAKKDFDASKDGVNPLV